MLVKTAALFHGGEHVMNTLVRASDVNNTETVTATNMNICI